jgi:hypothetical protein
MAREPSRIVWVGRFPTSQSTTTPIDGFRQKCDAFLAAVDDAGAIGKAIDMSIGWAS